MAEMTGGEVIAKMLSLEKVETVFGIIDGTYFGLYSNFEKYHIDLLTPRHETSAAHMAGAYARVTGKLGVCMASNGPGVANILPGLVVEQAEGNRVLVITSSRRTGIMYPDRGGTYQCFHQTGVIKQIAKWSETVPSFERIPELMRTAFRKCYEGRPGVVHIDVPENILNSKFKCDIDFLEPHQYRLMDFPEPSRHQVEAAADLLINAEFPIIHAGSGVIHAQAYEELEQTAELLQSMVTTSWAARGAFRESNPLMMPMIYIETNNKMRNEADVVLVLGSRIGETDWWGKAPYWKADQKVIQVDIDPSIIGANKPVTQAIQADVKTFLQKLKEVLLERKEQIRYSSRKTLIDKFLADKEKARKKLDQNLSEWDAPMNPAHVPAVCKEVFSDDTYMVIDGGNTAIWTNFYYEIEKPGSAISTYKFGMLGAGVGQAIGVAAANPDQPVLCIIGDGAMGFHPQEIETAVRNNLQVVYVVMCDKQWGMVKMNQHFALKPFKTIVKKTLSPEESINTDLENIQFDKLAESMGAYGEYVNDPKELKGALERALETGKCAVIHAEVDPVKHMWAPGLKYFKDMHQEPKGK
ncbi:acetolactate synthase-1/2/3 large subunit [Melghiribacillus thermohalophilus]|uniref:Acetolactate synthase-1/2/3 large subunit n=1 Tax=Melghiribacillus thermohalophilus TaxID=1324956 RepID=A0A4R3MYH6_9BACI|nr:thiamine pyrophosphate-binding protein [Melghiribacillus thermohalophilus]TCT21718.1 acetolactate synthase-1/2/3 large subunit [Melghiribacillus thermohalophilus]